MKQERAFTLIELLITLVLGAIILTIGVPVFTNMVENSRSSAQSRELKTAMYLARAEAAGRGLRVTVCAANGGLTGCDLGAPRDWTNGWIVFTDDAGVLNGTFEPGMPLPNREEIIRVWSPPDGQYTITGAPEFVRYNPLGDVDSAADAVFNIRYAGCKNDQAKQMTVTVAGLVTVTNAACGP